MKIGGDVKHDAALKVDGSVGQSTLLDSKRDPVRRAELKRLLAVDPQGFPFAMALSFTASTTEDSAFLILQRRHGSPIKESNQLVYASRTFTRYFS